MRKKEAVNKLLLLNGIMSIADWRKEGRKINCPKDKVVRSPAPQVKSVPIRVTAAV
jgi:hypothetical protein